MERMHNHRLVEKAKKLRKEMTPQERCLWYNFLRNYPVKFQRQKILGKYIVDFYCAKAKLVIEIDGSQHYTLEDLQYDKERTNFLSEYDITVLRFTNTEINRNFSAVCEYIDYHVKLAMGETR